MIRLKHTVFGLILTVISGAVSLPSYAYYSNASAAVPNSFGISEIRLFRFMGSGGQGDMEDLSIARGAGIPLPANTYTRDGCIFAGWNTRADGSGTDAADCSDSDLIGGSGTTVVLYAQWDNETGDLIEPRWDRNYEHDLDHSGTPDRSELVSGQTVVKDPSLVNHTGKEAFGYILVTIPTVRGRLAGAADFAVTDIAVPDIDAHWTQVTSRVSSSTAAPSVYLYRYNTTLKPYGAGGANPWDASRSAARSTDLMGSFTVRNFTECPGLAGSIGVCGVFIESAVSETEADTLAREAFRSAGLL